MENIIYYTFINATNDKDYKNYIGTTTNKDPVIMPTRAELEDDGGKTGIILMLYWVSRFVTLDHGAILHCGYNNASMICISAIIKCYEVIWSYVLIVS